MSSLPFLHRLNRFLQQPYPYYYRGRPLVITVIIITIAVFLFTYLFEPFVVNPEQQRISYALICLVHALVPAVFFGLFFRALQYLPGVDERWKVWSEILAIFLLLLLIGIGQFLIRDIIYTNENNWSWGYFREEVRNTLLVGVLFSFIFVPLNFNRLYRVNRIHAEALPEAKDPAASSGDYSDRPALTIQTQVKSDDFVLDTWQFLFARAEKNYVEIFLQKDHSVEKLLKRMSIKELEAQLNGLSGFLKIHRSYLVNLAAVEGVTGNAQGYKLRLRGYPEEVPVSRGLIPAFEEHWKKA